jgi:3-hydroxyisobutyrate dehydrogenase-like beta-hydroxyacid dehydrogenase
MGHSVGRVLREGGFDVVTCLTGRSERTRQLAGEAEIRDIPEMDDLVREVDLILAILVPDQTIPLARQVAASIKRTGTQPAYADCNAIAPKTSKQIDEIISNAGGRYIDAGIIGGPPSQDEQTRFYASGPHEDILTQLNGYGILVRPMGGEVGRASGIKMCYASVTKGTAALHTAVLTTAESLGLSRELIKELEESQGQRLQAMESIKTLSAKAFRWVGEMEEIAATYESAGVTPHFHQGAAEIFRMIADSPIGDERPETIDRNRSLEETVAIFAAYVMDKQMRESS